MFMLVALLLAAASVTTADYIVYIYEDAALEWPKDPSHSACVDNCHRYILNDEVFILLRDHNSEEIPYTRVFAPRGLNGLLTSPMKEKILPYLTKQHYVGIIFPYHDFHADLFPGVVDAEVVIPQHISTLRKLHEEKPVLVFLSQPEFLEFNAKKGYPLVAELGLGEKGFTVVKDLASEVRHLTKSRRNFGIDIHINT